MILAVPGVLLGVALLAYAADQFVLGAARVSHALRIPSVVIGAVIVGFGTSAPEMLASGLAAGQGDLDLGVGNVIGSNVANLTLVLGAAALVTPMLVTSRILRIEAPLAVLATILFAFFVQDGFTRLEGVILGAGLVLSLIVVLMATSRTGEDVLTGEVDEMLDGDEVPVRRESVRTLLGLAGTVVGAQLLVVNATSIADELGWTGGFVGFTVLALGTSAPELVTAVAAARRNETDLVIGNLLGSNLFNAYAVGAIVALIAPGALTDDALATVGVVLMLAVTGVAWVFMITRNTVVRWEAVVLVVAYVVCLVVLGGDEADQPAAALSALLTR